MLTKDKNQAIKIFQSNMLKEESVPPTLVLPVVAKEGDSYLAVDMLVPIKNEKAEWQVVDFANGDYQGIYTTGLTDCAALSIIKKNEKGEIEKVWMVHMQGGFNQKQMPDLPKECLPWDGEKCSIIGKYGISDTKENFEKNKCLEKSLNIICERYSPVINKSNITLFMSDIDIENSSSFAINCDGQIGLAHPAFPNAGVSGKGIKHKINYDNYFQMNLAAVEINYFDALIKMTHDENNNQTKESKKLESIKQAIQNNDPQDKVSTDKAFFYTRNYLCSKQEKKDQQEYKTNMNRLGASWGKIVLLVVSSFLLIPAFYTLPKLGMLYQQHKTRNEMIMNTISFNNKFEKKK